MRLDPERVTPKEIRVPLDGKGAAITVRTAETFEHMQAAQRATRLIAAIVTGEDSLRQVLSILGQDFDETADVADEAWRETAARCITLLELVELCAISWEGILDRAGNPIAEPRREYLALLLRDPHIADRIGAAIRQRVDLEAEEGNGSAASPSGAAASLTTASNASGQERPAAAD